MRRKTQSRKKAAAEQGAIARVAGSFLLPAWLGPFILLVAPRVHGAEPSEALPRKDGSEPQQASGTSAPTQAKLHVPRVVLPRAISTPVQYPDGENSTANVLMEITVDRRGRVSQPTVLEGKEPFASAATAAVDQWQFAPATRDDEAVASRIRFLVRFSPPEVVPSSAPSDGGAFTESESAQSVTGKEKRPDATHAESKRRSQPTNQQSAPLEVTITGERLEPAVVSMGRADVEQLPGAFGDPFRAVEALPGITPIVSGLPFFFIRGAPPGNQGYFLDGIRVPLLYHMAAGPGVIHPALVDRVDLHPGGYPARFGRFAGAIVSGESKDPPPEYHAQASVRLVDSGGYVTAPLGRGAVALGGRYSYTGAVVSLIAPQVKIEYWDYQAKAVQYLSQKDTVGVFAFGALDLVQDRSTSSAEGLVGTEFHRVDLRYQRTPSERTRVRSAMTFGLDKTLAAAALTLRDRMLATRGDVEHRLQGGAVLRAGIDAALDAYDVVLPIPDRSNVRLRTALPERTDVVVGAWADMSLQPSRSLKIVPGLRVDRYWSGSAAAFAVEPRLSATYEIRSNLRIVHALGLAQQPPSFIVPVPGVQISGLREGLQRSIQSSAGVELDLPKQIFASVTFFQNAFFNLTDQLSAINRPTGDSDELDLQQRARGRIIGGELLLRRPFSQRVGGLLAYTLSKSWRTIDGIRVPASFDRRHVLQAALAFNLGRNWRSSIRGVVYSGIPSQSNDPEYIDVGTPATRTNAEYLPRTPAFWRLDLRLQKRWYVGNRGAYWAATLEVLNATLNREAVAQYCSPAACRPERIGPITIPSLGVEAAY